MNEAQFRLNVARTLTEKLKKYGFAIGGSYALSLLNINDRKSHDIDVFASAADLKSEDRECPKFSELVDELVPVFVDLGLTVEKMIGRDNFARFCVSDGSNSIECDLTHHNRFDDPVIVDGIAVVNEFDAEAGKLKALYERGFPRDYVDAYKIVQRSSYTRNDVAQIVSATLGEFVSMQKLSERITSRLPLDDFELAEYGYSKNDVALISDYMTCWAGDIPIQLKSKQTSRITLSTDTYPGHDSQKRAR